MADVRVKVLVYQHDGTVISQYLLGEGVHVIGRDPNSAIYAESAYISNEHAKLHLTAEGIFIEDLNSTSGTLLDNITVRGKVRLSPGQLLQLGDLYIDLQLEAAGDLSPGVKIGAGRYQLVKELGRGAMGQVWLGQDTQLDEYVAIKVLNSEVASDAVSLLALKREVQKSRKLSHDNIIRIHDLVQLPGENPFITLEYVEGTDLHAIQLNQPDHIFQWLDVKPYVLQLCEAMDYAHERKIVHRDLKPPNVMITKDGVLKLADFGIAASIADATGRSSMANIVSGTPQFMSPQQMLGKSPKASDDIYSLGATIYDLLTGRPPFHTGDIAQQVHHVTPAPIEQRLAKFGLQNSVPDYVNSVVLSCLAKDPTARPTSAGAIGEWIRTEGKSDSPVMREKTKTVLEKITPEEPIQAEVESAVPVVAQSQAVKGKKSPVLAIAAVAAIAVILGVLFLGESSGQDGKEEHQYKGGGPQASSKGAENPPIENAVQWNGHWYAAINERVTWKEAEQKCMALKGHLVTIESEEENNFLAKSLFKNLQATGNMDRTTGNYLDTEVWIGASADSNGEFKWVPPNGRKLSEAYSKWWVGTPFVRNHSHYGAYAHFAAAHPNPDAIGFWSNDSSAEGNEFGKLGFVCEWEDPQGNEKVITIDQSSFSKVYPAVYFSPSDGDITPIVDNSDDPPAEKFEVWIEPNDPEINFVSGQDLKQCGFIYLGHGLDTFNEISESKLNSISPDKSGDKEISKETITSGVQPVFLVIGKDTKSIIVILSCDPKAQKIQFKWKKIYNLEKSSNEAGVPGQNAQHNGHGSSSLKQSLVAYYSFNGNANDESDNGNDGDVNDVTLVAGRHEKQGSAYSFDGVESYIHLGKNISLGSKGTAISGSAWIRMSNTQINQGTIIGQRNVSNSQLNNWQFIVAGTGIPSGENPGQLIFTFWHETTAISVVSNTILHKAQWHHVAFTYDGATLKLFINGVLDKTTATAATINTHTIPTLIGKYAIQDVRAFRGEIDDVRIYDRALSAAEVLQLYDLEKP